MKLYYHKTSGGAEYLMDTFIPYTHRVTGKKCKEGVINDDTKYIVRIDGDITKDAELNIRESSQSFDNADICELAHTLTIRELGEKAEKVNKGDVTYTSRGQKAFDYYYDLITNTLNI